MARRVTFREYRPGPWIKVPKYLIPDPPRLWSARDSAKFSGQEPLRMHLTLERGVPQKERYTVADLPDLAQPGFLGSEALRKF